jgi:hypothetical protein
VLFDRDYVQVVLLGDSAVLLLDGQECLARVEGSYRSCDGDLRISALLYEPVGQLLVALHRLHCGCIGLLALDYLDVLFSGQVTQTMYFFSSIAKS